ncbi:MAG: nucleotide disphospho-sugar-binding domain-containing protein [Phycisphaeraceae bacterium]
MSAPLSQIEPAGEKPRILFVAEAVTLAHVARPAVLARALDLGRYEVHFACDRRGMDMLTEPSWQRHAIDTIASQVFLDRLAAGAPLYQRDELVAYIARDRQLLGQIKPAAVIGDFRLSLAVSAPLEGVPYINLTNAHWSPYAAQKRFPLPEHALARLLGPGLGQCVFDLARPVVFASHARTMNRLRREHGLPLLGGLTDVYTWGDHVLYADVPELVATRKPPANHHYIGPVTWSPPNDPPAWWDRVPAQPPPIYVTLGSSGQVNLLPEILGSLADYSGQVMAATAGRIEVAQAPANARVAKYLPGEAAAARSAVVVCNGGSAPVYQALAQGTPVIGVASNMDQYLTMGAVERAGAGLLIRAGQANGRRVRLAVDRVVEQSSYRQSAGRLAEAIRQYDTGIIFNRLLASLVA